VKRSILIVVAVTGLVFSTPAFAQRSHGGGPPAEHGAPGMGSSHGNANGDANSHASDMSHGSPSDVLSHNHAIGDKIKTLTGQDAATACGGFKNIGQCIAAAHVAKNLDIPGGFDALKAKMTGSSAMSLGKAIQALAPNANAKDEEKKAKRQTSDDLKETNS
jgi:hypothetical protein